MTTDVLAAPALSAELRARTASAHAGAEHSPFLSALVAGEVGRSDVAALLGRLLPVYGALERAAATWADDPAVGALLLPGLARSARLADDLALLTGAAAAVASPAAAAYAARIEERGAVSAPAFVAHHYTRCLGDLSGGQVMRAALDRSLGLVDGAGGSFLSFPDLRPGDAKRSYRAALDALPFGPAEREELVDEALLAYRLNVALTAELDAAWTAR